MKTISVVIPCYNEEVSVAEMYGRVSAIFSERLPDYNMEIIYADDCSPDRTWEEIEKVCAGDKRVKGVHNVTNFGAHRNIFAGFRYAKGDAVFMVFGDLQDPPEMLPKMVEQWERGKKVVIGQKSATNEGVLIRFCRSCYYALMNLLSAKKQIRDFNGFGLYDRQFVDTLFQIDDMQPFLKGIVAEYGGASVGIVKYEQAKGRRVSNYNFLRNYDFAVTGITSYTKNLLRMSTFAGLGVGALSLLAGVYILIAKLINWDEFPAGIASVLVGVSFLGAVQLFFLGVLGEYVLSINERSMKRPITVADVKLNFERDRQ